MPKYYASIEREAPSLVRVNVYERDERSAWLVAVLFASDLETAQSLLTFLLPRPDVLRPS